MLAVRPADVPSCADCLITGEDAGVAVPSEGAGALDILNLFRYAEEKNVCSSASKDTTLDHENSYRHVQSHSTPRGTNWPRVSSRLGAGYSGYPAPAGRAPATNDAHKLPYRQPHLAGRNSATGGYTGGEPLKKRGPAPIVYDGHAAWNATEEGPALASPGIEDLQMRHAQHSARNASDRNDRMGEMQARFNDYAQANDFQVFNSAVNGEPEASNSTKIQALDDPSATTKHKAAYDPTVPSYAKPKFEPQAPPPESQRIVAIDEAAGKPEVNEVRLRQIDNRGEASRAYPSVYRDAPFLQLPQSNLIVNPVPAYLTIDSRDRDRTAWKNSNYYRIPLVSADNKPHVKAPGKRYKNIYSISLLSAVVPKASGVLDEPYLLMQIDEISNVYDSANPACSRAFTKLYFKEVWPGGKYLRMDKGVGDPLTKIYWPAPRASLDSITISFRRYDGTLFDFGPDSMPPADPLSDRQTSITLEIRTFVVDAGKALGR